MKQMDAICDETFFGDVEAIDAQFDVSSRPSSMSIWSILGDFFSIAYAC